MASTKQLAGSARPSRAPRQLRSEETLAKIAEAVISILADEGPGAVTHRRVAEIARVSLASTTYYYESKFEMIAAATERLLAEYVHSFDRVIDRHRQSDPVVGDLPALMLKLLVNASGHHGRKTLAWCEIMLDCARSTAGHALARRWLSQMDKAWTELVLHFGVERPHEVVGPAIDTVMGLLFLTQALGLSPKEINRLFRAHERFDSVVEYLAIAAETNLHYRAQGAIRAAGTRDSILESAVQLLIEGELGPLSYRAVAKRTGITSAAVAYHFPSSNTLYDAAQCKLFGHSLEHLAGAVTTVCGQQTVYVTSADLATVTFVREVTEHGPLHLASFSVWLDATRKAALRPSVVAFAREMVSLWSRWLDSMGAPARSDYALFALGHFTGKIVRSLTTGVTTLDLAPVRGEFELVFQKIVDAECPFATD